MSNKDNAEYTLDIVNSWINNIDSKASYALSLAGILIGFILIQGLPKVFLVWIKASEITVTIFVGVAMVILLYVFSLFSICSFVSVLISRVAPPKKIKQHLFFGSIATYDLEQFTNEFLALSDDDYVVELIEQVHTNSCICSKKIKWYNQGVKGLFVTIVLCFGCIIFQLI